jgi:hypothetical protein
MSHLNKLEDRGCKLIFVGYERGSKAYRAYNPTTKHVHHYIGYNHSFHRGVWTNYEIMNTMTKSLGKLNLMFIYQ